MAEKHVRAVQHHSGIQDNLTRHILEVIALDIGRDDSPAITSNRKIARRARCAVNTARDRIEDILKTKELYREFDGKYTLYRLNPELIPYDSGNATTPEGAGLAARFVTVDDLTQFEERLCQHQQGQLYQLYQNIVSIVSSVQTANDTKDKGRKEYIGARETFSLQSSMLGEYIAALAQVVKTAYGPGVNEEEFTAAAEAMIGWDTTPEQIAGFSGWWKANGHYEGRPALTSLLNEYRNYLDGTTVKAKSNGHNGTTNTDGSFY